MHWMLWGSDLIESNKINASFVVCGGLNMLGPWSGTIRKSGLFGVSMALLEEVCHCEGGLYDPPPSCLEDSLLLDAFGSR